MDPEELTKFLTTLQQTLHAAQSRTLVESASVQELTSLGLLSGTAIVPMKNGTITVHMHMNRPLDKPTFIEVHTAKTVHVSEQTARANAATMLLGIKDDLVPEDEVREALTRWCPRQAAQLSYIHTAEGVQLHMARSEGIVVGQGSCAKEAFHGAIEVMKNTPPPSGGWCPTM